MEKKSKSTISDFIIALRIVLSDYYFQEMIYFFVQMNKPSRQQNLDNLNVFLIKLEFWLDSLQVN